MTGPCPPAGGAVVVTGTVVVGSVPGVCVVVVPAAAPDRGTGDVDRVSARTVEDGPGRRWLPFAAVGVAGVVARQMP